MSFNLKEQKMDLLKPKGIQSLQMTFDENINVPDIKPDMDKILQTNGQVFITKEDIGENELHIGGVFKVNLLYVPINDKKPVHSMDLVIPFEEVMHAEGIDSKDYFKIENTIEDLSVSMLNSRKINIKSIAGLKLFVQEKKEVLLTRDVEASSEVEKLVESIEICQLKEAVKSHYKIKDDIPLPSGKPNIMEILWYDTTLQNRETKLIDGKVNLKGTLHLATLYMAGNSENNLEFVEHDLTFNGLIDCSSCKENMIHDVQMKIENENIQIKLDLDGEERVIAVEVDTGVDIKIYDEEDASVLSDVYALDQDLVIKKDKVNYQKLLCKNQSQTNIKETIIIDNEISQILQIFYTSGNCVVDQVICQDEKIKVEGTLFCKIMYVVADDNMPIHVYETIIPFDHYVDIKGFKQNSQVSIVPSIHYIGCMMIGEKEIELKCAIQMNTFVFEECSVDIITGIEAKPFDLKLIQKIPGIVGYIVKDKESLWDIAKTYKTKVKSIQKTNGLESDYISKGDHLVIVKELQF